MNMHSKNDNKHKKEIFYDLNYINNYIIISTSCMVSCIEMHNFLCMLLYLDCNFITLCSLSQETQIM